MKQTSPPKKIAAVFERAPVAVRKKLLLLRTMILAVASKTPGVGRLDETIKWDAPSYLTSETQSGTTIRIGRIKSDEELFGIFVHCQSNVVKEFREKVSTPLKFDKTRGIILNAKDKIPDEIHYFIYLALTYHLRKKKRAGKDVWNPDWIC